MIKEIFWFILIFTSHLVFVFSKEEEDNDFISNWIHFEKVLMRFNNEHQPMYQDWFFIEPTFSCKNGLESVGIYGDGIKWVCNIRKLKKNCVIYSIGSNNEDQFEKEARRISKCSVHTFDPGLSVSNHPYIHNWVSNCIVILGRFASLG